MKSCSGRALLDFYWRSHHPLTQVVLIRTDPSMWNDTDIPIAHFISFRCYGTWLHGDERGSINRSNNQYQSPYIEPNAGWKEYNATKLKDEPNVLSAAQREVTESAIREVCEFRRWALHAISVRTITFILLYQ